MSEKIKNILNITLFSVFLAGLLLWAIIKPDSDISLTERRKLAKMPELSSETVLSGSFMKDFETYALDQFPMRDRFRQLKAISSFYLFNRSDNNGVYISEGHAAKLDYPINEKSLDYVKQKIDFLYEKYLKESDSDIYFCLVPDKNVYLAPQGGYPHIGYDDVMSEMKERIDYAEFIDISSLLELDDYYTTDLHWREERLRDVAEHITESMGEAFEGDFYETKLDIPFYGVYYGQSALPMKPDTISHIDSEIFKNCRVFDYESNCEIPVHNMELANGKDPYEMFLNGSRSLITIENPDAASDKELIIFRDSFGSSLAPWLTGSYKKITLVDIRYMQSAFVGNFVEFSGQDVLFMYSIPVLNNSETLK